MKLFKVLMLLFFVFGIVACSSTGYSTKPGNYLRKSKTVRPIVVPPNTMAPAQKPYYPVPNTPVHVTAGHPPSLKPPGL